MKGKLLNIGLVLSSLIGYLEWGTDQSMYLFQAEADILGKLVTDPMSVAHPFIILPLLGQLLLITTLFGKKANKVLTFLGIGCIGLLLFLMFFIGVMEVNFRILLSTLPFLILSFLTVRFHLVTRKR